VSRYNLKFEKKDQANGIVFYDVVTCDFSECNENQLIGKLEIDIDNCSMSFYPGGLWEGVNIVPFSLFELPEAEGKQLLRERFASAKYTDWAYRIFKRAQVILNELN